MASSSVVSRRPWGSLGDPIPGFRGPRVEVTTEERVATALMKIFPKMVIASGIKIDSLDEDISKYLIFLNKRMSHGSRYKMAGYRPTYNTI